MVTDLDIYRTAKLFVDKHGAEAPIHAAMKADAMLDKGDMDGKAVWLRVVKAIEELLRNGPKSEDTVHIKMTLTSPMCPVAESLPPEVERKVKTLPEINTAKVDVVWDPPWAPTMMSEAAKLQLNMM